MKALAIVVLSVLAAVTYGILHDQITARVCIEYFTIGHPPVFSVPVESPTIIAFAWGILATWWVGLALGIPLAIAARAGARPKISASELFRPLLALMGVAGALALGAGILGYFAAANDWFVIHGPLAQRVPQQLHAKFIADFFAHTMSYAAGIVGGIVLVVRTWCSRRKKLTNPESA
jgi:hypothetical protein